MEQFKRKFATIQTGGFSTVRRLPRLGRIRLGKKVEYRKGNEVRERPIETPYFVVPPEVARIYGPEPRELDVMLPSDDREIVFPQALAWYGQSAGLKCHGNGVTAERFNEQTKRWEERACPCEQKRSEQHPRGECTEQAHLMVLLPRVSLGGVYQITTRSFHSVVDINSGLDFVRGLVGRIALIPLKLRREERMTHHGSKPQTHYTMTLTLDANVEGINRLREETTRVLETARYQIEGPVEVNPAAEPPDEVVIEDAEVLEQKTPPPQAPPESNPPAPPAAPPAQAVANPVTDRAFDAEWLSEVLDLQEALRQTQKGAMKLRDINGAYRCQEDGLPMPTDAEAYRDALKRAYLEVSQRGRAR